MMYEKELMGEKWVIWFDNEAHYAFLCQEPPNRELLVTMSKLVFQDFNSMDVTNEDNFYKVILFDTREEAEAVFMKHKDVWPNWSITISQVKDVCTFYYTVFLTESLHKYTQPRFKAGVGWLPNTSNVNNKRCFTDREEAMKVLKKRKQQVREHLLNALAELSKINDFGPRIIHPELSPALNAEQ